MTTLSNGSSVSAWLRAIRIHQWAKNLLLLLPALAAHRAFTPDLLVAFALAFASFSLLASAVYLLNDLADLEHDRVHPQKRNRPLASGLVTPRAAIVAAVLLAIVALLLAVQLPPAFLQAWVAYLVLTTAYSFGLKRAVMLDVLVLAALYTFRVVAGAAAVGVPLSRWFLACGVFLFLSLALLKRFVETRAAGRRGMDPSAGRGYQSEDALVLLAFGTATAAVSALVYCLYITTDDALLLYARPDVLWLGLPLLLYWLGRVWLLANRGEVDEDPVLFALRDPVSYVVLLAFAATVVAAT